MGAILLQQRVTMTMDAHEAWALRNALGAMSVQAWKTAGLNEDGIKAMAAIYNALDAHLKPQQSSEDSPR
jgi:hypothetical protein